MLTYLFPLNWLGFCLKAFFFKDGAMFFCPMFWHFPAAYLMSQSPLGYICLHAHSLHTPWVHLPQPADVGFHSSHLTLQLFPLKLPSTRGDKHGGSQKAILRSVSSFNNPSQGPRDPGATLVFSISVELVMVSLPKIQILESVPIWIIMSLKTRLWSHT